MGIGVGTFTLMGQIAFTLNIKAEAQKSTRSKDYDTHPLERGGAQHYHLTDLPVYGIGRSFETFGWVPPMIVGWGETSSCATLWGCGMVHRGKNTVNGSKNPQFPPVMCVLCVLCARFAQMPPRHGGCSQARPQAIMQSRFGWPMLPTSGPTAERIRMIDVIAVLFFGGGQGGG